MSKDDTIEQLPTPSESTSGVTLDIQRDSAGVVFDPERHATKVDPDGTRSPKLTKTGRFTLRKKRDRIAAAKRKPLMDDIKSPEAAAKDAPKIAAIEGDDEFRAAAGIVVKMIEGAAVMTLSPDCKMDAQTQGEMMTAWTAYFRAKGVVSMPPSLLVASSTLIYLGKSLANSKQAQSKLQRGFQWFAARAARLRGSRAITGPESPGGADGGKLHEDTATAGS